MELLFETSNLLVRKLSHDDASFIIELVNSKGWLQFIGDRNVHNANDAIRYMNDGPFKSYEMHGFGLSAVCLKNNTPIGLCGLLKRDYLEAPDLGFAFLPEYSGKGYAYEGAKGYLDFVASRFSLEEILAITLPDNVRSIALLKKLGFDFVNTLERDGERLSLYSRNYL